MNKILDITNLEKGTWVTCGIEIGQISKVYQNRYELDSETGIGDVTRHVILSRTTLRERHSEDYWKVWDNETEAREEVIDQLRRRRERREQRQAADRARQDRFEATLAEVKAANPTLNVEEIFCAEQPVYKVNFVNKSGFNCFMMFSPVWSLSIDGMRREFWMTNTSAYTRTNSDREYGFSNVGREGGTTTVNETIWTSIALHWWR